MFASIRMYQGRSRCENWKESEEKRRKKHVSDAFTERKLNGMMRKKLVWSFGVVILALVGLAIRITYINATSGEKYRRQVLTQSQQQYESRIIPFKRGDILDTNGTILATSEKVYNVILDCRVVNSDPDYVEPTVEAMVSILGLDEDLIREKLTSEETKSSQYQIVQKELSITDKQEFEDYCDTQDKELSDEEKAKRQNIKGVWFEENYLRTYPLNSLACDVIGFTYSGDTADWGIEGYYSDTLTVPTEGSMDIIIPTPTWNRLSSKPRMATAWFLRWMSISRR